MIIICLSLQFQEKLFQFQAIGLEKLENTEIVIDDKAEYLKCTKEEYNTLKKRMTENFTIFYRKGVVLHFSYRKSGIEYIPIEKARTYIWRMEKTNEKGTDSLA